jgi:hypothetical protein
MWCANERVGASHLCLNDINVKEGFISYHRTACMEKLFKQAAKITGNYDLLNMEINVNDRGTNFHKYHMNYNKNTDSNMKKYCGSDWTSSPGETHLETGAAGSPYRRDFHKEAYKILNAGKNTPTINKVAWFGSTSVGLEESRRELPVYAKKYPDLFVFRNVNSNNISKDNKDYMSLEDMVSTFSIILDIGGIGYSGRLKYLLYSGRPLIFVDRPYVEYFHDDLIPYKHYIPVKRDLSDLVEKTKWILENYDEASKIGKNARDFALNEFTADKFSERILHVWKNLQNNTIV